MNWTNPTAPNLADFTSFVQNGMSIPTTALPADSPWLQYALDQAIALTLNVPCVSGLEYTLAVYNCGGHVLLTIAPDQTGQTYFATARSAQGFNLIGAEVGVLAGSSDQSTSQTIAVPDSLRQLSFGDLQFLKTPWGRAWLAYGQDFGQAWGLT